MSVWEVGRLESHRRLRFDMPCDQWVVRALEAPGLSLVALSPTAALQASRLPGHFRGDPVDRILAATAREIGATIVTRDSRFLDYAAEGYITALTV